MIRYENSLEGLHLSAGFNPSAKTWRYFGAFFGCALGLLHHSFVLLFLRGNGWGLDAQYV